LPELSNIGVFIKLYTENNIQIIEIFQLILSAIKYYV